NLGHDPACDFVVVSEGIVGHTRAHSLDDTTAIGVVGQADGLGAGSPSASRETDQKNDLLGSMCTHVSTASGGHGPPGDARWIEECRRLVGIRVEAGEALDAAG